MLKWQLYSLNPWQLRNSLSVRVLSYAYQWLFSGNKLVVSLSWLLNHTFSVDFKTIELYPRISHDYTRPSTLIRILSLPSPSDVPRISMEYWKQQIWFSRIATLKQHILKHRSCRPQHRGADIHQLCSFREQIDGSYPRIKIINSKSLFHLSTPSS